MSKEKINDQKDKLDKLIIEMSNNRIELKEILDKTKKYRNSIETLVPKTNDFRYKTGNTKTLATEQIDSAMNIIKTELTIRKNIDDSIKTESDLRRRLIELLDDSDHKGSSINISELSKILEESNLLENVDIT